MDTIKYICRCIPSAEDLLCFCPKSNNNASFDEEKLTNTYQRFNRLFHEIWNAFFIPFQCFKKCTEQIIQSGPNKADTFWNLHHNCSYFRICPAPTRRSDSFSAVPLWMSGLCSVSGNQVLCLYWENYHVTVRWFQWRFPLTAASPAIYATLIYFSKTSCQQRTTRWRSNTDLSGSKKMYPKCCSTLKRALQKLSKPFINIKILNSMYSI